jgi:hypothetical protein
MQFHPDWIVDRLPTKADCYDEDYVIVPRNLEEAADNPCQNEYLPYHRLLVGLHQPWWSPNAVHVKP